MKHKNSSPTAWIIVGTCFITLGLDYSVWYSFSVFFVALLKEFGWSRSTVAGAFSLFLITHGIIGSFAGRITDRFSPKKVFSLGSLFLGGGLVLCSLINVPWQFYLFFGFFTAIGVASVGWIPNTTLVQQWFKEKKGLATGVISSGVGIGIFIYVPTIQYIINQTGWRNTYLIMACFIPLMIIAMSIIFLKRPPQLTSHPEMKSSGRVTKDPLAVDEKWGSTSWTLRKAMDTKQFWILSLFCFLSSLSSQSILAHQVAFFVDQGLKPLSASYMVGMIGIVSMGSKILWGILSDRIGRELTYTIGIGCSIFGMVLLIVFTFFPSPSIPYLYALLFGMGYAVTAALPPLIIADFFGGEAYGSIFGTLWILNGLGSACGAWFAGYLFDQAGCYVPVFIIMIVCALLACMIVWKAAPREVRLVPGKKEGGSSYVRSKKN